MYQALYRKWRPQTFDQVIGQEHITETLKNQIITGRLSHAYIFIGTRGTGKTTCARILARAVNCEHPVNGNPCGECPACRGIMDGSVLDVVELDAASNNGVDNVRALRDEAVFSPASVRKRVYIVDEVHMLSTPAFNALLKILEEPPEHLMFILATTELQKVPATILSRCQRHSFKRIDTPKLAGYLRHVAESEKLELTDDASELLARLAEGGVRDGLSLLDQCSAAEKIDVDAVCSAMGLAGNRRVAELLDAILLRDTARTLTLFNGLWMDGKDPASLLSELSGLLRDILMIHAAPKAASKLMSGAYDSAALRSFAQRMTTEELLSAMTTVQGRLAAMKDTGNPKSAAELCLVSLCESASGESVSELRARISRLEEQIKNGIRVQSVLAATEPEEHEEEELPTYEEYDSEPQGFEDVPPFDLEPLESAQEDELDPEMFAEEQPEDVFLDRAPSAPPAQETENTGLSWNSLKAAVLPKLSPDVVTLVKDEKKVRGSFEGDVLRIESEPGFTYNRLNRQVVLQKFSQAAAELAGREIRIIHSELSQTERTARDINELKQYPEVKFI